VSQKSGSVRLFCRRGDEIRQCKVLELTKDNDGVGVIAAATRLVSEAVGLLVRVCTLGDSVEKRDDFVGLGGSLGLDAGRMQQSARQYSR